MLSTRSVLSTVGVGAAVLIPQAAAQIIGQDSIARCRFTGMGVAGSMSQEVAVDIVETVTAYVCNSPMVDSAQANVTAMEVAEATAFAIASITAQCYANGRSSFRLNGLSLAQAEATAIASSLVSIVLEAEACGTCQIAAELFAEAYQEIFVQATAMVEANLEGDSTFEMPAVAIANAFAAQYINATATAYASVLANVQAGVGQGCNATALFKAGDLGRDGAECLVDITAANNSVGMNAYAEIFADLEAAGCNGGNVEVSINATVEAIAAAQADALARIAATCNITGDAFVCAYAEADVNATAMATAEAFAFLYAAAVSGCPEEFCDVNVEILTEAVDTVLAEASAAAFLDQCSTPDNVFDVDVFQRVIQENTLVAFAAIIANVSVINDGMECILNVDDIAAGVIQGPNTTTIIENPPMMDPPMMDPPMMNVTPPMMNMTPPMMNMTDPVDPVAPAVPTPDPTLPDCFGTCVGNNRRCFGSATRFGSTPAPCCSADYSCVRRNARFSQCRRNGSRLPSSWDGSIEECNPV